MILNLSTILLSSKNEIDSDLQQLVIGTDDKKAMVNLCTLLPSSEAECNSYISSQKTLCTKQIETSS